MSSLAFRLTNSHVIKAQFSPYDTLSTAVEFIDKVKQKQNKRKEKKMKEYENKQVKRISIKYPFAEPNRWQTQIYSDDIVPKASVQGGGL